MTVGYSGCKMIVGPLECVVCGYLWSDGLGRSVWYCVVWCGVVQCGVEWSCAIFV